MEQKIFKELDKSLKGLSILLLIIAVLNLFTFHFITSLLQFFIIMCIYFFDSRYSQNKEEVLKRYCILAGVLILFSFFLLDFVITVVGVWLLCKAASIFLGFKYNLMDSKGFYAFTEVSTVLLAALSVLMLYLTYFGYFTNFKSVSKDFNKITLNSSMSDVKKALHHKKFEKEESMFLEGFYTVTYSYIKDYSIRLRFDSSDVCVDKSIHYGSEDPTKLFAQKNISFASFSNITNPDQTDEEKYGFSAPVYPDDTNTDDAESSESYSSNKKKLLYSDLSTNLGGDGIIIEESIPSYADTVSFLRKCDIPEDEIISEKEFNESINDSINRTYFFADPLGNYVEVKTYGAYVTNIKGKVNSESIDLSYSNY